MENRRDAKQRIIDLVRQQPDGCSFDDILRELAFVRMVERGIADANAGRLTAHADVVAEFRTWRK